MEIQKIDDLNRNFKAAELCSNTLQLSSTGKFKETFSSKAAYRKFKAEQCGPVKLNIAEKPEISATFTNTTDTEVRITISEIVGKHPFVYSHLTEITLSPGQMATVQLKLEAKEDLKRSLRIETEGGQGYGSTGSCIDVDLKQSKDVAIDLFSEWVHPGEDFWPPVDSFQVVKAKIHHS